MDVSLGYENMNSFPDVKAEKKTNDRVRSYRKILFICPGLIPPFRGYVGKRLVFLMSVDL